MTKDQRSAYYMTLLGEEYVNSHFGDATPLAIQQLTHNRHRRNPLTLMQHIVDAIALDGTEAVLDVGCGNGFILRDVASRMRAGGQITAIDISAGMLAAAKENVNFQWCPITWIEGDGRELPTLIDDRFDIVMANYVFHYISDPQSFCSTLRTMTKPGGRCIVTVEGLGSMEEMYLIHLEALRDLGISEADVDGLPQGRRGSLSTHNGNEMLSQHFSAVTDLPYSDALVFTEVEPFLEFYAGGHRFCGAHPLLEGRVPDSFWEQLADRVGVAVQKRIDEEGAFIVNKENTVFSCTAGHR
ncbi:class I SAM-dependent methyltransferase [Clavibacter sp. VKM Ac-2872]|uniref:class I SAM-dependent methyltransferase n=1 Tax=Clavibacter sp. VKM Ac-2872 TaxID=2783812 RepID=UPI00188AB486|nr:class I SAM-dependent methyltransferase [Clavibacter sp. VKM Ac-2872]MBF4625456.1 methyltransferase domain-containing protein [Clavibacter sp. VKM Ac-2872]